VLKARDILQDSSIDMIVEESWAVSQMPKMSSSEQAIRNGKGVVTANKALIAKYLPDNAIEVISTNLRSTTYIGQRAGRYPTANSCVNDIASLAKGDQNPTPFNPLSPDTIFVNNYASVSRYSTFASSIAIKLVSPGGQFGEICEKHNVSIYSILQNPVTKRDDVRPWC
jgi:hypothetical protein